MEGVRKRREFRPCCRQDGKDQLMLLDWRLWEEGEEREGGEREEGGRGLVGGSGGKKSVWDRLGGIDGEESNQPGTTKVPHLPLIH